MSLLSKVILPTVLSVLSPALVCASEAPFRRGDANSDGRLDLSDAISTLHALFLGGTAATCDDASDANDDGRIDISDPLSILLHLFLGGRDFPAPIAECGPDPTPDSLGCGAFEPCRIQHGQSEFATPLAGGPGVFGPGRGEVDDGAGPPAAGPPAPQTPSPERLIEEGDIYKLVDSDLYVLNRYRGLQIIDISNLDRPRLVGRAPIFGWPKEMYVRGTTAYVVVSDYYTFWRAEESANPYGFYGSQLRIIDLSDLANPTVVGGINLAGDCSDSRIVGDVMYLVSHRYPWYSRYGSTDTEDLTQVLSVALGDPADVHLIDSEEFPRNGWEHHIYVTQNTIYLAATGWTSRTNGYETRIRYIDISDPLGAIRVRGETPVDGHIQDRWQLDEHQGVLRVASGQFWGNGDVFLTTFDVSNPDSIRRLGRYTLHVNENLTAARFDGDRAYLVSYRNIDPLFTFDLSDPTRPRLLGELEMTGWLDFIVPMGDRLVALGHEDRVTPEGWREISLAVSLIDVSSREKPQLLSRVSLDGVWGWVPGERDDFAKVFRVVGEQGLIVFPFQAWSRNEYRYIGGVQLIDFDRSALTLRGLIGDAGWVERGVPHGESTVLTIASEVMQIVDIANRDAPRVRARLELARNVQSFAALPGGELAVQLSGDWYRGDTQLTVTPLLDPDTPSPISRIHIPSPYGRMFVNGSIVYVASVVEILDGAGAVAGRATKVEVVDLTDPTEPRRRGSVTLPEEVWVNYGSWYWGWGDEAAQVDGSTLAFHRYPYYYWWWDCFDCPVGRGGEPSSPEHKIYLVDLADPDAPSLASTVVLKDVDWAWGLKVAGTTLYLSSYTAFIEDDQWMARYFLHRIQVANPASPVVEPPVNIPGMFIDATPGTPYIYTVETWWEQGTQKIRTLVHALAIEGDEAFLQSSAEVEGYLNGIQVEGAAAFGTTYWWEELPVEGGGFQWVNHSTLVAIDLADPKAIRVAGGAEVPFDYAYMQEVEGGRAFLGTYAGIFTYLVSDIETPAFEAFFRTQGWSQDIVVEGDHAFVPSGYYGVQILELGSGSP